VEEEGAGVAESTVRDFVRQVKAELAGEQLPSVPITQEHLAGAEAEVDFGEFYVDIGGQRMRVWLFVMRLSCSAKAFAMCFAHQAQEAFFEGHVLAFEHFDGVPGRIRYGPPPCSRTPWMTGCPYGTRQRETTTKAAPEVLGRVQA
jgi:transposase